MLKIPSGIYLYKLYSFYIDFLEAYLDLSAYLLGLLSTYG